MSDQAQDPVIMSFRERISEADRAILETLNRRIALVSELHAYKLEHGYPLSDPTREAALVERLEHENGGPLTSEGLREIYGAIVAEWKRHAPVAPNTRRH